MSKKDEALKLALEALEETRNALAWFYDSYPHDVTKKGNELLPHVETVLTAMREALAEQPVQQRIDLDALGIPHGQHFQPAQQEPVAWDNCRSEKQCRSWCGNSACASHWNDTPPPASKPWVGLTDEEMRDLEKQFNAERVRTSDEEYLVIYPGDYWAWQRAIEAKLREKNT